MGRTSAPRRRVAVFSTATRRWSRRGREVLLGKQDLPKAATAPACAARLVGELSEIAVNGMLSDTALRSRDLL